jgi:hypothetical protein
LLFDEHNLTDGDDARGAASEGTDLVVKRMSDNKEKHSDWSANIT